MKPVPDANAATFRERMQATSIGPAFIHAMYLINLGTPNPDLLKKSVDTLVMTMQCADTIGARGVIFHCGSHKGTGPEAGLTQLAQAVKEVLKRSPSSPWLLLENSAGAGDHLCSTFEDIGRALQEIKAPNAGVCLDTQHAFAAGYHLADAAGLDKAMRVFDRSIGLDRLMAVHANDSKTPLGSGVDRHENIGDGQIGTAGFAAILSHNAFRGVPLLLEVPGLEGTGPDKANVDRLKAIRAKAGVPA
jgi:deoxyribonuclease-4